ncbi:MAG: FHA domain-containing protein [Deltaproteobacteria bacterium]|nr:FHA domain-containing protein [Deltaproteobacteria bacterium]
MLLRIHQVAGAHAGRVLTFDQDVVRLGRMPDSDVAFDAHADLDASGRHAELRRQGEQWILRDAGSRNGTFINGEKVDERLISTGDIIECGFGGPRIRLELIPPREASAAPSANTEAVPMARPNAPTAAAQALPPMDGEPPQSTGPMGADWGAKQSEHPPPVIPPSTHPPPRSAPPAGAPPVSGVPRSAPPPADKKFGQRTVGMMVSEALDGLRQQNESSSRRWKLFAGCLGMLLGVVCIGFAVYVLAKKPAAEPPDVSRISASTRSSLWRLTGADGAVFCTAFAVRRDLVATSGQCVLAVESRQAAGKAVTVVSDDASYPVVRMWRHPETPAAGAMGGIDVGLVEIGGEAPAMATLAGPDQLTHLDDGVTLVVHGYTGASALAQPITLTGAEGVLEYLGAAPYGAPLFDASGAVVGLHGGAPSSPVGPGQGARVEGVLGLLAGLGR